MRTSYRPDRFCDAPSLGTAGCFPGDKAAGLGSLNTNIFNPYPANVENMVSS